MAVDKSYVLARPLLLQKAYDDVKESPSFWSDPLCFSDLRLSVLKKFLPRLLCAVLWFYFGTYVNNLSMAWLQNNVGSVDGVSGFYDHWGHSNFDESNGPLLQRNIEVQPGGAVEWPIAGGRSATLELHPRSLYDQNFKRLYQNKTITMYDIGFLYLPHVESSLLAEWWLHISFWLVFIPYIIVPGPLSMRWTMLCRMYVIYGCLYLCRALTILVTPLPNPYKQCVSKLALMDNVWKEALNLFPFGGDAAQSTCQDCMFSGHATMGTCMTLVFVCYLPRAPLIGSIFRDYGNLPRILLNILGAMWVAWGCFTVIASQFHYSLDVVMGVILTCGTFGLYHQQIKLVRLPQAYGSTTMLTGFLLWFEEHATDLASFDELLAKRYGQMALNSMV